MDNKELLLGHYLKGNEPIGCFNSGVAPCIARSKQAKKYLDKEYVVGRDIDVTYNLHDNILMAMRGERVEVTFYQSKKLAFEHYNKLCDKIDKDNEEERKHIIEVKRKAEQGDMQSILALNDY